MVQALEMLCKRECLQHPRVLQAQDREPPALVKPQCTRRKKEIHKQELCKHYECVIARYTQAGWEVFFPHVLKICRLLWRIQKYVKSTKEYSADGSLR